MYYNDCLEMWYLQDSEKSSGYGEYGTSDPSLLKSLFDMSLLHNPSELPISALEGKMSTSITFLSLYRQSLVCTYVPVGI